MPEGSTILGFQKDQGNMRKGKEHKITTPVSILVK
jgi:hypothetical protein